MQSTLDSVLHIVFNAVRYYYYYYYYLIIFKSL